MNRRTTHRFRPGLILAAILLPGCSDIPPVGPLAFTRSSQTFSAPLTPQIGVGDLDGDGDPDAVFATMGFHSSQVLWNDGDGHFTDSGQELTQQGHGVGVGDLDGDGDPDLFVTCAGWRDGDRWYQKPSKIYFNDGAGRFRDSGQDLGDTEWSGTTVDLIDFDSDGDLDAHVKYYPHPDRVYLNDGHGRFPGAGIPVRENADWGDLDADGDPDMFVRVPGVGVRVFLNEGDGRFRDRWAHMDRAMERVLVRLGDLNGDGVPDAVVTNGTRVAGYPTTVFFNDGTGAFAPSDQTLPSLAAGRAAVGDLDGDGDADLFLTSAGAPHAVWVNDGQGRFADSGVRLENSGAIQNPILRDLNDDGRADIFIAHFAPEEGTNEVWFNQTENHHGHRSQPRQRETSTR